MKKRYQIDKQRAVQQFRRLATEENPNIQMVLPLAEIVGLLQEGVGHLLREAGLTLMSLVMEEEVRHFAGERHEQHRFSSSARCGIAWFAGTRNPRTCRPRWASCIPRTAENLP